MAGYDHIVLGFEHKFTAEQVACLSYVLIKRKLVQ